MSLRLLAAGLAFTTLTACAIPRTAIVAGAVTAVAGGMLLSDAQSSPQRDPHNLPANVIDSTVSYTQLLVGTMTLLLGAGLITSGAIGLGIESEPVLAPVAQAPATEASDRPSDHPTKRLTDRPTDRPAEPATLAPPGSATAVLAARAEQLTSQIWIESRAGHCGTATAAARRLAVLDRNRLIALIDRNATVASCLAYRM
jgi:hypothetical protein